MTSLAGSSPDNKFMEPLLIDGNKIKSMQLSDNQIIANNSTIQ
jgi:hypothetical protein